LLRGSCTSSDELGNMTRTRMIIKESFAILLGMFARVVCSKTIVFVRLCILYNGLLYLEQNVNVDNTDVGTSCLRTA
jgi:hypothetical protein